MQLQKVLFFITESMPTAKEKKLADSIAAKVCFRNARFISAEGCIESCDFVLGAIPETYSHIPIWGNSVKKSEEKTKTDESKTDSNSIEQKPEVKKVESSSIWKPNA